jgi:hypothetical protein
LKRLPRNALGSARSTFRFIEFPDYRQQLHESGLAPSHLNFPMASPARALMGGTGASGYARSMGKSSKPSRPGGPPQSNRASGNSRHRSASTSHAGSGEREDGRREISTNRRSAGRKSTRVDPMNPHLEE